MADKKRILVTASTFPRWKEDTEPRFVLDLAEYMAEEFSITVLAPAAPGAKDREVMDGVHVIRYHYFPVHKWETLCYPGAIVPRIREKKIRVLLVPFLFVSLWWHLLKLLPEYDMVHAHWLIPQGIVQSFFKKPYIVTGHGGDVTSLNKGFFKKLKIRCLKNAQHVTVVSEYLKNQLLELVPGINPSVISMGVDTEKFGKKFRVTNYFGQGNRKVVLFVGRLAEVKGVQYLIEAMKQVDALLVIVGDGSLREELEIQSEKISGKVRFLGAKTHDELRVIYASADILVVPSVLASDGGKEGFGLVMLEAMASGLSIVASDSGGISQLIHHEINGLLCEEKNTDQLSASITRVLNDEELYSRLCENAKRTLDTYGYGSISRRYAQVYEEVNGSA